MGKFTELLEKHWAVDIYYDSKMEFIGEEVFYICTGETEVLEILTGKMLSVLKAIINRDKAFIEANFYDYSAMVNMTFLSDKIDFGTSIQSAWLCCDSDFVVTAIQRTVKKDELKEFIQDLIDWAKTEIKF